MVPEDEGLMTGAAGRKKRPPRAGELYDAFAGESDEEFVLSDDESDDGGGPYRDTEIVKKEKPPGVEG